jgi:putative phosphonate metabolism protein
MFIAAGLSSKPAPFAILHRSVTMAPMPSFPEAAGGAPDPAAPRYALYVVPQPGSALENFGATWLGRDAVTGEGRAQPTIAGIAPERLRELTATARGYGFHATIKPPFYLRDGRTEAELIAAFEAFAAPRERFQVQLGLKDLSGFLALMMTPPDHRMHALATEAVRDLDPFRALPGEAELARRRAAGLSAQQEAMLQQWGYPYVMGEFRFHMTLSPRLPEGAERDAFIAALAPLAEAATAEPLVVDAIALFKQAQKGAEFLQVRRFGFGD